MKKLAALAPLAIVLAACSSKDDPVSYSAPVGISLPVASSDVTAGSVSVEKNINTESGNPYGAFVTDARARIGHDPSRIAVMGAAIELLPSSSGVTALEQVFTGAVDVSFVMSGTNAAYQVGQLTNPTGTGLDAFTVSFDSGSLPPEDQAAVVQGQFKVVLSGTPAAGFETASAKADLKVTFVFFAYE